MPVAGSGLKQIAPGLFLDPAIVLPAPERKWLLLDEAGYASLGLKRQHWHTLERLFEAQEIRLHRVAPRVNLLDLDSWRRLLERVAEDPWYWEDARRLRKYREGF